ncbi:MAG: hypothetical protein EXR07_00960 [Acetobacteraceae bacterium]|nr:hypothetical protein [Acetobacteraceae bacterium]
MKLAVASCAKLQDTNPQPVWAEIQARRPDVLLLLGDNIYLSHDNHDEPAGLTAELQALYAAQFAEPNFAALLADLRARNCPVLAIYDDHDFLGNNRYGGDYGPALRQAARDAFIRAFAPAQTGGDVYHLHHLGPIDIAILDERFYRRSPAVSSTDRDAILGGTQWAWLEQIVHSPHQARYLVIASSTTLHTFGDESWEQYPAAFHRLVDLLHGREGALVLSGDVHRNAVYDDSGVIEIVTSAVARKGLIFGARRKNYGLLTFDDAKVNVDLQSLKSGSRFNFDIPLNHWELP